MAKKLYVVMGATGQIGHVVVEELLQKGHQVRAIGRDPQKLQYLKSRGAETTPLDNFAKVDLLSQAFQGADGVFTMLPPGQGVNDLLAYQQSVGEAINRAIQNNSIHYVVNLSSLGADLPEGTGPIQGLGQEEKELNALPDLNVIHLRPGYFLENLMWSIPVIVQTGTLKTLLRSDLSIPFVATPDIGLRAAAFLDKLDFKGHSVFEMVGPRSLTMVEVTKILGKAIGKPDLKYEQLSYDEARKGMISMGMKKPMVDLLIEMYTAFNEGKIKPKEQLTAEHIGKLTIEEFANYFGTAYKQAETQKAMA